MQFVMHSYTFRNYSIEEAFRSARRFGWEGIELQPCHFNRDRIEEELPAAIAMGERYNVPVVCVDFGGDFISDDATVRAKAIADMERDIEVCSRNGVRLMNGCAGVLTCGSEDWGENGSALATDEHYARAAEAFRHLGILAAEHCMRIVFEIHMNTIHDTIASTARLLDAIALENVMANPDPGNMFATSTAERDPAELDQLAGRIGYFHLKNCTKCCQGYDYSVKLTEGQIDLYAWVAKLADQGYNGRICVEYCGQGDPHAAAQIDAAYVQGMRTWIAEARG